jgi:aromatic-L-amino-acid decarboxylase
MNAEEFRRHGHEVIDWVADYLQNVEQHPVLARVAPGDIRGQLPQSPPRQGEDMGQILRDFREIILPGVTHWNHPRFFAYFPANNSGPSILGELLSAALGINAMLWQTCPAATELEEQVMDWLRQMIDLPAEFRGVIQDTASTATLCALICARERLTQFTVNEKGFVGEAAVGEGATEPFGPAGALRVYTSCEGHSSVEKGVKLAGFGAENLVKVEVDANCALDPEDLERRIVVDRELGLRPCCVVATTGTTSSTAMDPLTAIGRIARKHGLWFHIDAALAGSAAILPEKRWILDGAEQADSLVFNPHKWLYTNFDCSAYFTRDAETLLRSMSILPEYLRTDQSGQVTDYRDWGIPLGRRFRALKLWFVLRHYGVEGLQRKLRQNIAWAEEFASWVQENEDFELLAPVTVNTVCFRYRPGAGRQDGVAIGDGSVGGAREDELERLNKALLDEVNASGRIYMTHTKLNDRFTLRLSIGQTQTERRHVVEAWECIRWSRVVGQKP